MHFIRSLLTIGTMGAILLPTASLALDTGASASANASYAVDATDPDFLNTFVSPVDTDGVLDASFDVRAFTAHPCFNAVGQEQEYCLRLFGIDTDFESMLDRNALGRLIIEHTLEQRCEDLIGSEYVDCQSQNDALLPGILLELDLTGTGTVLSDNDDEFDDTTDPQESRRTRMERLWELCEGHELSQAGCYQSFIGTINRATIDEIEELFGEENGVNDDRDEDDVNDDDAGEGDVRSDTVDEDSLDTRQERAEWLWDLCADSNEGRTMCYRHHYRTVIGEDADLTELENDIRG